MRAIEKAANNGILFIAVICLILPAHVMGCSGGGKCKR